MFEKIGVKKSRLKALGALKLEKEQIKGREDPTHELILYPFSLRSQGKLLVLKGKKWAKD
ncbi:hypothetical protein EB008_01860 [bacterium]|nr:hypothetical protein [bacterium]